MEKIYLQENFTSLYNSVYGKVSGATQKLGVHRFYRDKIPIESTTNGQISSRITKLIVQAMNRASDLKTFHIYEFGAGIGILAWRILLLLQRDHPALFEKTIIHLSDISVSQIENLKKIPELSKFGRHLVFDVVDACHADFKADEPPLVFYHTYLFDSLPTEIIHIKDKKLSISQLKPWLPSSAVAFDYFEQKASFLKPADIRKVLESADNIRISNLWDRLPEFEYDIELVPIEAYQKLDADNLKILKEVPRLYPDANGYFAFGPYNNHIIENAARNLHPEGFHLMIDIGSHLMDFNENPRMIWRKAGVQYYCQVNMELLRMAANHFGQHMHVAEYIYPRNHACVFTKKQDHWIQPLIKQNFSDLWLLQELINVSSSMEALEKRASLLEEIIIPERADSMNVQFQLGYFNFMLGRDDEASEYFKESLRLSLNTYILGMILIANLLMRNGKAETAQSYIDLAIDCCPNFKMTWQIYAAKCKYLKDFAQLRIAEENILEVCSNADISSVIADLIEACELDQDASSVAKWKKFLASKAYEKFQEYWKSAPVI